MSSIPDAITRKRRARAAWAYSFIPAKNLNAERVPYGTLKGLISETGPSPSLEQAVAIAEASGLPGSFILTGDMNPPAASVSDEIAGLADAIVSLAMGESEAALLAAREAADRLRGETAPSADEEDRPDSAVGDDGRGDQ